MTQRIVFLLLLSSAMALKYSTVGPHLQVPSGVTFQTCDCPAVNHFEAVNETVFHGFVAVAVRLYPVSLTVSRRRTDWARKCNVSSTRV